MSEATILNAQPVRTLVKEEEMPIVNTSSTSSSPTSNNLPSNKQESDQSDATDALSSFNKTLLDQEAHDGLLVLAQLNHQDHISDSDEDENESVSKVSALYSLLQDDSDDGEHVSSLPPSATVGTNTPSLVNTHLAKRASRMAAQQESSTTNSNNSSSNGNKGSTTPKPRKRKTSRRSAMEEDEIADAGAMENDDDEYVADAAEEDDEEMALAGVKKRSSTRRERSPGLGANAASSSSSNRMDTTEDEVISEEDLIHCVVCKRSNLQVNFKKNYTINTNNYKTYCDTFPQQSDQIPKPRDGESLSVCSTCYNKQWRFARGQYDPSKNRVVNKREGLKNPPKLKDSPRPGEDDGETPNLGLSTPNLLESPPPSEGKKRKVTKRRASTSTTSTPTEDSLNNSAIKEETTSGATTAEETAATIETPKKRAKRAVKAKKAPLPTPPLPSDATATTAATNGIAASAVASSIGASTVPISTLLPGTVMIANGASTTAIPSPSPNKRGRKSKNPPANIGVVSGAPATSYKKEESLSPPPPVISNTALLISYMKRINGILEEIYTTKIVTQNCPDTIEQLRDLVMERLTQKKGELFSFDRACCNSVDRFNNSIKVEVDEFFFKDVKLNNNDSLCIYVNDK